MDKSMNPSEIAREAIRRLAEHHLSPTPANYQMCYNEIARLPNTAGFPEASLRRIALALKAANPSQQQHLDQLDKAIGRHSWQGMVAALTAFSKAGTPSGVERRGAAVPATDDPPPAQRNGLREKLAQTIECLKPALEGDDGRFAELVASLLLTLRDPAADAQTIQT